MGMWLRGNSSRLLAGSLVYAEENDGGYQQLLYVIVLLA